MEIKPHNQKIDSFIGSLEVPVLSKVLRTIDLLERFGPNLGMPYSKKLIDRLFELRVRSKQEVRIIYTFHHGRILLLHGFIKKTDKIPKRELRTAKNILNTLD